MGLVWNDSPQRIRNRQVIGSSPIVGSIPSKVASLQRFGIAPEPEGRLCVPLVSRRL